VSTLAHVFEAAGLSTVVLASMKEVAEKMAPPRTLYCEFPLGRPLGRPGDAAFQRSVLDRALALLYVTQPVLDTYPEVIESDETPLACSIPPRFDPSLPPAVDEARGLRAAYDRSVEAHGVTSVGRAIDADTVTDALGVLHQWAEGVSWQEVSLPGRNTVAVCHDIRAYYTEAALELAMGPAPAGRAVEAWFWEETDAGATMMAARRALQDQGAPFPFWFYMAPGHR
jgi:D-proline reductase (dithiol) PrdB